MDFLFLYIVKTIFCVGYLTPIEGVLTANISQLMTYVPNLYLVNTTCLHKSLRVLGSRKYGVL